MWVFYVPVLTTAKAPAGGAGGLIIAMHWWCGGILCLGVEGGIGGGGSGFFMLHFYH